MAERPITPPPELFREWTQYKGEESVELFWKRITTEAARWGADQELEACLDEIYKGVGLRVIDHGSHRELLCSDLRAARRLKPPSLKEQALDELDRIPTHDNEGRTVGADVSIIRRALNELPE